MHAFKKTPAQPKDLPVLYATTLLKKVTTKYEVNSNWND
jgi:hypothetical protein